MSTQQSLLEGGAVQDVDIAERMEQSFLDYSMSVIVGRALPDVRDGLKPVQRRILYAMWEAGLRPDRPYRKCASAVGDVMKKYHPHGDASIYDALVRMAQDFTTREPLVDGHGNFGSMDGDGAAAMRYTEARLSPVAMALLDGIDESTVEFVPNYDGYEHEPVVLPARVPNLLVNGASGIAVGMATSIPPHNLGETIDACLRLIAEPETTVDALLETLRGPDFPTGARVVAGSGIRDAYLTGRGAITMEAVATTETRSGGLPRIVVTEIPYQVNKATLLERIAELVKDRKIDEIRDLRDESSRDGTRVVIELKRGEQPARVLDKLYRLTDLRRDFNVNLVALVDGQPRVLGLRDCLLAYLDHQRDVLTRRTTYRRDRAAERAHVLEGLLTALEHLDEVIALIRAADDAETARGQLMQRYGLTERQATAVLDMPLRRLAALERQRIAEEHAELTARIAELEAILADPARLDELLADELSELRDAHATPRRSRLVDAPAAGVDAAAGEGAEELPALEAQPITVAVSAAGQLRATPQRRRGKALGTARDPAVAALHTTTAQTLVAVDAAGTAHRIGLGDVPVVTGRQRGVTLAQLLGDRPEAPLVGAVVLEAAATLVTVSARGQIKRTAMDELLARTRSLQAAGLRDGDALVAVAACDDDDHLVLAHDGGQVLRFPASEVRVMGRTASGVAGMEVPAAQEIVAVSVVPGGADAEHEVLALGGDGAGRRHPLTEYPVRGRGGKGVRSGVQPLVWAGLAADLHVTAGGEPTLLAAADVPQGRRGARPAPLLAAVSGPVAVERTTAPDG